MAALATYTIATHSGITAEDFAGTFLRVLRTGEVMEVVKAEQLEDDRVEVVVVRAEPGERL